MRTGSRSLAAIALTFLFAGCETEPSRTAESGTGSETTNHIAGMVVQDEFLLSHGARVVLVPLDFNPLTETIPAEMQDTTDFFGRFRIEEPRIGDYQMEIHNPDMGLRAHVGTFNFHGGQLTVPVVNLEHPGVLQITLPERLWTQGGYLYIPGTTFKTVVGESRVTSLTFLPVMWAAVVAYAKDSAAAPEIIAKDVWIGSGDTTDIPPPAGGQEAVLRLNTTTSGAGVKADVTDFPMLVRLDTSNFDFTQTPDSAAGISFHKPDGTALPFEVERWDDAARKAEIWVRMDTVKGNTLSQEVVMRWGSGVRSAAFATGSVFNAAGGFEGVWHMGGSSGSRPDASGNGRTGTPHGFEGDESVEGIVGAADQLDRTNDLIDVGIINVAKTITLSAWVRPQALTEAWGRIVEKPYVQDTLPWDAYSLQMGVAGAKPQFTLSEGPGPDNALNFGSVLPGAWIHLHGVYDGNTMTAYINGRSFEYKPLKMAGGIHQNNRSTIIGAYTLLGDNKFFGSIDEVRIESVARSAHWIKLSYENQRASNLLVRRIR